MSDINATITNDKAIVVTITQPPAIQADLKGVGPQGIQGIQGVPGEQGVDGDDGLGVPAGGTTGQVLTKTSNADNDTEWATPSAGDMDKSVYDTDNDGRVDAAESVSDGTNTKTAAEVKAAHDHISRTDNPHSVTKSQVGLANADNTSDVNKPVSTATQTALDLKVDENVAITGATKTKVTYDAKGLVTSGADATTADIADSSNKRYVTDANLVTIGNQSGTNTGDSSTPAETTTTIGSLINGATDKTTPIDADYVGLMDSAASNILKKLSWANIKATLKTYFDTLYAATLGADDNYVTDAEKVKLSNLSGTNTGDQTLPVKATGAETDTGTDDAKFLTPKAIEDSSYIKSTGNAATATALATPRAIDGQNFDGTAAITVIAPGTHAATGKTTPVDADELPLIDSDASNILKKLTWANLKATLKTYFDTLYLTLSGGTLTGVVDLGENAGLKLDAALSADGKYSGITEAGTAGAALAFGDLVYLNNDDSRWEKVDANVSDGYDKKLGIVVLAAAADGDPTTLLLWGKVRADTAFPTLTVGAPVYMSETAGGIVVAQPTTADVAIRIVGFANTTDELFFNPSNDYITHI